MRYCILIILFFSLSGCQPDKEPPAYSTALQQIRDMIDKGDFSSKYVILEELISGTIGSIYRISPQNYPIVEWSLERPKKVTKHKGKFICYANLKNQTELSYKELVALTDFENDTDSTSYDIHKDIWLLGVSKDGKKHTLVDYKDADARAFDLYPYVFPKLWEYMFKDCNETNPPRFVLGMYSLDVDDADKSKDSLKKHLEAIRGEIYFPNSDDKYFTESKKEKNKPFFAVLNGKDTLKLVMEEIIYQHLYFESTPSPSFFESLPEDETWDRLYNLMRDSTFYFQYEAGKYEKYPLFYSNYDQYFEVRDKSRNSYIIPLEGVIEDIMNFESYEKWRNAE